MPPSSRRLASLVTRLGLAAACVVLGLAPAAQARGLQVQTDPPPPPAVEVDDTLTRPDVARRATALEADDPVLPRGSFEFRIDPSNTNIRGLHRDGRRPRLGEAFFLPEIGPAQLPALAVTEARFRELAENGSNWTLNLGSVGGRIEADEQVLPVRIGYGLLDRVTVGVTVPFVRRRVRSTLTAAGTDATAGENPSLTDPESVNAFLAESAAALADLQERVEAACADPPDEEEPPAPQEGLDCADGQDLLGRAGGFLQELEAAYDQEIVFPLRGSAGAAGLGQRWDGFRGELAAWEVEPPDELPVARFPLSDAAFGALFVDPVWGSQGFPRENPDQLMQLGDVEAHVVLGLLRLGGEGEGFRIRSSVVGTARFPTGAADSLQAIVPFAPPRGVFAGGARFVADAISPARFGALFVAEGWWHGEAETVVLAPDPDRLLGEGGIARAAAVWQPGASYRFRIVPRAHLTPSLSVGLGYQVDHRNAHRFELVDLPGVAPLGSGAGSRVHRLRGEFRYHGFEDPVADLLPFPLEVLLGYEATLAGTGPFAPRERKIEMGVRVLRGG